MVDFAQLEVWFATGTQSLYGEETLRQVAANSQKIAEALTGSEQIPVKVVFKPVLTSSDAIERLALEANSTKNCIGLITWMHTFSPAKMWIAGLSTLRKPFVHLHTQFGREIPWDSIDMDFMNLNQSAHGGREFGFICSRMRLNRKVIVGHWQDTEVLEELGVWIRAAAAWNDSQHGHIARFGENMRNVAVTDGDKVEAQRRFGYTVSGYGVGDLVQVINGISDLEVDRLLEEYMHTYSIAESLVHGGEKFESLRTEARTEIALKAFLADGGFTGFTNTFEDLHGMPQLPGLATQRVMAAGYGYGAEGDWKTAALVRAMKVMGQGLEGGASFMEDYTYHFSPEGDKVLGAHMLEVCPTIAEGMPSVEVHPLGIGGKDDPVRLGFNAPSGSAINATIIDLGNRFRMVTSAVEVLSPEGSLQKLPVARAYWKPLPNLKTAAAAWIYAGGAHHTAFSQAIDARYLQDFAEMAGIECVAIDSSTSIPQFKDQLRWNDVYYLVNRGL